MTERHPTKAFGLRAHIDIGTVWSRPQTIVSSHGHLIPGEGLETSYVKG